jgi:hypothetical protein
LNDANAVGCGGCGETITADTETEMDARLQAHVRACAGLRDGPTKCPRCGKKVPKVDPDTARKLLTRHLVKCAAKPMGVLVSLGSDGDTSA